MWMIIFLILPFMGIAYVAWHVWELVPLSPLWRVAIIATGIVSFLMIFLNLGRVIDRLPMTWARLVYDVGNSSIFVLLYLVIVFLLLDVARLVHLIPPSWLHHNFVTTAALAIGLFALFLYGNIHYYNKARQELTLTTEKPLLREQKVIMLSDLHLGYHNPRKELARWVDIINAEQPDLVLIAGDIIDMSIRPLIDEDMAAEIRRIHAPIYACLGNHEYYTSEPLAERFFSDACINLLRDTVANVGNLCIIGRDDRTNTRRKSMEQLAQMADHSRYTIVLDHQPYDLGQAEQAGIDLQFSGHTHYGQVWPVSWITHAIYECPFGSHTRGKTRYYVSSGLGIWGGKYRIGTRSEYVVAYIRNY